MRHIGDTGVLSNFDLAPDGARFVVLRPYVSQAVQQAPNHATWMLNFFDVVRQRAADPTNR